MGKYRLRLGKSIGFCSDGFYTNLQKAKDLGFDTIDFDVTGCWSEEEKENGYYRRLEEGMDAVLNTGIPVNGIHISFGWNWDISETDETKRAAIVDKIRAMIRRTSMLSPYCYILHGSFEPIADENRAARLEAMKKSMRELSPVTDKYLCLEDLPRTCLLNTSEEIVRVIDDLALPNVKICADVNHFLQEKSEDAVLKMGNRIYTTHISDHDYVNERHWLPGKGKIDWMKLIGNLEKIGYNGVFNYETGSVEEVKENYVQLFKRYNKEA
ncbi:MAG: sugar phosphate isomerase/epimerase family protein [Candidatus Scatosoma sp.]